MTLDEFYAELANASDEWHVEQGGSLPGKLRNKADLCPLLAVGRRHGFDSGDNWQFYGAGAWLGLSEGDALIVACAADNDTEDCRHFSQVVRLRLLEITGAKPVENFHA